MAGHKKLRSEGEVLRVQPESSRVGLQTLNLKFVISVCDLFPLDRGCLSRVHEKTFLAFLGGFAWFGRRGYVQASWQIANFEFRRDDSNGVDLEVWSLCCCSSTYNLREDPMVTGEFTNGSGPLAF